MSRRPESWATQGRANMLGAMGPSGSGATGQMTYPGDAGRWPQFSLRQVSTKKVPPLNCRRRRNRYSPRRRRWTLGPPGFLNRGVSSARPCGSPAEGAVTAPLARTLAEITARSNLPWSMFVRCSVASGAFAEPTASERFHRSASRVASKLCTGL